MIWTLCLFLISISDYLILDGSQARGAMAHHDPSLNPPLTTCTGKLFQMFMILWVKHIYPYHI